MKSLVFSAFLMLSSYALAENSTHIPGTNVQVVRSQYSGTWGPKTDLHNKVTHPIDFDRCEKLANSRGRYRLDCTKPAYEHFKHQVGYPTVFVGKYIVTAERHPTFGWQSMDGVCDIVHIQAAVKSSSLNNPYLRGVGFYLSTYGFSFVEKRNLRPLQEVTLKNGASAYLMSFIGKGDCYHQPTSRAYGSYRPRQVEFKPFTQERIVKDGTAYYRHVWDFVKKNYLLGCTKDGKGFVNRFDRSREVLKFPVRSN